MLTHQLGEAAQDTGDRERLADTLEAVELSVAKAAAAINLSRGRAPDE
ncbi:hypothetical protein [Nonomuraea sp. NPDC046570]